VDNHVAARWHPGFLHPDKHCGSIPGFGTLENSA
jgi:hypothetical protein